MERFHREFGRLKQLLFGVLAVLGNVHVPEVEQHLRSDVSDAFKQQDQLLTIFAFCRTKLKDLDYFLQQKDKALTTAYDAIAAVLKSIENFNANKNDKTEEEIGEFFRKMLKVSDKC